MLSAEQRQPQAAERAAGRAIFADTSQPALVLDRRAGSWLTDFTRERVQPGFDLQKHIEKIAKNGSNGDAQPTTIHRRQP